MEQKYYVYVHKKGSNGHPFYVGKGTGKRLNSSRGRNIHWNHTVAKHNFTSCKLVDNVDQELAYLVEQEAIDQFKRIGCRLVNKTAGGEGQLGTSVNKGKPKSEETRQKLSKALSGRTIPRDVVEKAKETKLLKGFKPSPSFFRSEKNPNLLWIYTTPYGEFKSVSEISKASGLTSKQIRRRVFGSQSTKNGKIYSYPAYDGWSYKER